MRMVDFVDDEEDGGRGGAAGEPTHRGCEALIRRRHACERVHHEEHDARIAHGGEHLRLDEMLELRAVASGGRGGESRVEIVHAARIDDAKRRVVPRGVRLEAIARGARHRRDEGPWPECHEPGPWIRHPIEERALARVGGTDNGHQRRTSRPGSDIREEAAQCEAARPHALQSERHSQGR